MQQLTLNIFYSFLNYPTKKIILKNHKANFEYLYFAVKKKKQSLILWFIHGGQIIDPAYGSVTLQYINSTYAQSPWKT